MGKKTSVQLKNKPRAHICLITFSVIFTHKGQCAFIFSSTRVIKVCRVSSQSSDLIASQEIPSTHRLHECFLMM